MKVKFKVAVKFDGHVYKPGAHKVPDHIFEDHYFQKLMKSKWAVVVEAPKPKPVVVKEDDVEPIVLPKTELPDQKAEEPKKKPSGKKKTDQKE